MNNNFEYNCIICSEFLGSNNPRQLCGKTYCINIDNIKKNEDDMFTDIYYEEEKILKETNNMQDIIEDKNDIKIECTDNDYTIEYANKCLICELDLGENNNRQLCGKTYCMNIFN